MTGKRKWYPEHNADDHGEKNGVRSGKRSKHHPTTKDYEAVDSTEPAKAGTPPRTRRGRPPGSGSSFKPAVNGSHNHSDQITPLSKTKRKGRTLVTTPDSQQEHGDNGGTEISVPIARNADSSARRKSARTLIERTVTERSSEGEELAGEGSLARRIWRAEGLDDVDSDSERSLVDGSGAELTTPSKRASIGRKRPRRKRSPTPPHDLAPNELYFSQNAPGRGKTSSNTLSSLSLLTHEQYHNQINAYNDPHASSYRFLHSLHFRSFPQWRFELSESFNICLYGYGSKRRLVTWFADYLCSQTPSSQPIILVVNGYHPTISLHQILNLIASQVSELAPLKLPFQPVEAVTTLVTYLSSHPPEAPVKLFINSLDAPPLRRAPIPTLLAQLAASPHISLLATCDQPNFPLLWDTGLLEKYNWIYHDTTTFIPYGGVEAPAVIDDVNELLGRSGRTVKGKEGVGFVLRSLPENARNLYRILIAELLAADAEDDVDNAALQASNVEDDADGPRSAQATRGIATGIDYRVLYQKVVEEFICSNEMAFRQLLKEFHDHQMIVSRKDGMGGELLGVPFRREEMESILEDLVT